MHRPAYMRVCTYLGLQTASILLIHSHACLRIPSISLIFGGPSAQLASVCGLYKRTEMSVRGVVKTFSCTDARVQLKAPILHKQVVAVRVQEAVARGVFRRVCSRPRHHRVIWNDKQGHAFLIPSVTRKRCRQTHEVDRAAWRVSRSRRSVYACATSRGDHCSLTFEYEREKYGEG